MGIIEGTVGSGLDGMWSWRADWVWGLLLIFLTVIIHIAGLGFLHQKAVRALFKIKNHRHPGVSFVLVIGTVTILTTVLHVVETILWAGSYRHLNAIPDGRAAVLYSLNAMTSYGHESIFLDPRWQLLGAAEALNGWLLFGLTTAFLFSMFQMALKSMERRAR
jgi:hypothetical protein